MKTSLTTSLTIYALCVAIGSFFYLQKTEAVIRYRNEHTQRQKAEAQVADLTNQLTQAQRELYATNRNYAIQKYPENSVSLPIESTTIDKNIPLRSSFFGGQDVRKNTWFYKDQRIQLNYLDAVEAQNGLFYNIMVANYPTDEHLVKNFASNLLPPELNRSNSNLVDISVAVLGDRQLIEDLYSTKPRYSSKNGIIFYVTESDVYAGPTYKTKLLNTTDNQFIQITITFNRVDPQLPPPENIMDGLKEIADSFTITSPAPNSQ